VLCWLVRHNVYVQVREHQYTALNVRRGEARAHTHTHTYVCVCVCECMYVYIYTYIYTQPHTLHTRAFIRTHMPMYITYVLHTYTCIHTHIHTYIHTYIHTHTHTHTHTQTDRMAISKVQFVFLTKSFLKI
jgi:hypothetical protein